jgi:hypothetical protein
MPIEGMSALSSDRDIPVLNSEGSAMISPTSTSRKRNAAVAGAAGLTLLASGALVIPPAHSASPLDASGVDFSFVDPADVLSGGAAGDSFFYANVATIDGVQVDATLTILESFNSLSDDLTVFVNQNSISFLNPLKLAEDPQPAALEKTGCYTDILVDGNPFGAPTVNTVPSQYRVGSEVFDSATSFEAGSDFVVGSEIVTADEADPESPEDDRKIKTEIQTCGGPDFTNFPDITYHEYPGFVRFQIDFSTGVAKTPVQLANLTLSAFDIDGGQYLRLFSPLPDSYRVFDTSLLEVCGPEALTGVAGGCTGDYAGSGAFLLETGSNTLEFYGDDSSEDGEVFEWAAEATYAQPLSSLSYQFGVRSGMSGSSLEIGFESIAWTPEEPELAETGPSTTEFAYLLGGGLLTILFGSMLLSRRTPRASRA